MCHPTFLLDQLIIPSLPAFLPHPWPPHLPPTQQTSNQQPTNWHLDNQFPTIHVPATWTNGLSIFPKPPHPGTIIPFTKRPQLCHYPQIPPIEAYITSTEQAANKLPSQEADELRSDVNRILKQLQKQHNKQCNLNPPMQSPHRTQTGQFQGGSYSGQRGDHGHHGPKGLH